MKWMFSLVTLTMLVSNVQAKEYQVLMKNKTSTGLNMGFEPDFLKVNKGDTVKFIPVDKGHSAESFKGGLPKGVKDWKAGLNKEIVVKFDVEGVHMFKCLPHFAMGMIGAVQVGPASNLADIKKVTIAPKIPKERWEKILAQIK